MAHRGFAVRPDDRSGPAFVGAVLVRLGLAALALTLPAVAGTFAGLVATAGSPAAGAALALGAMDGPLLGGAGLRWLFHVSTFAGLCGCWLLGAGLLLDGLFD